MSAFAVSGVILGVIPICQAVISQHASTVGDARQQPFMRELSNCIRRLRMQHTQLELSVRKLLSPVLSSTDVDEMIWNPLGPQWKDPTVRRLLYNKHGDLFTTFEREIVVICGIMTKIAARLGLGDSNMTIQELSSIVEASTGDQPSRTYNFAQRLTVSFNLQEVKGLFKQLKLAQTNLDSLVHKNDNDRILQSPTTTANATPLEMLRKRAMALYTVLAGSAICNEHPVHCANLRLEYRLLMENQFVTAEGKDSCNRFRVALAEPWGWQSGEFFVHDASSSLPQEFHPTSQKSLSEGEHICPVVKQYRSEMPCLGFCIDMHSKAKLTSVYRPPGEEAVLTDKTTSLDALLTPAHSSKPQLSYSERLTIATVLASSVRQLHTTHWLMETWSEQDIIFLSSPTYSNNHGFDIQYPYLAHRFGASADASEQRHRTNQTPEHKRSALVKLGIILMELWFGRKMENQQSPTEDTSHDRASCSPANALRDWIHCEGEELPKRILRAVAMCQSLDLQDENKVAEELSQILEDLLLVSSALN